MLQIAGIAAAQMSSGKQRTGSRMATQLLTPTHVHPLPRSSSSSGEPPVQDLRWRAAPQQPAAFAKWFEEQLALSSRSSPERGLYVGLRLDGRVRASGKGSPPWAQFVAEIAPLEGMWKGLGDGFDGAV